MNKLLAISKFRKFLPDCRSLATRTIQKDTDSLKTAKSKNVQPRITLIAPDNSISITDMVSAQNMSMRRELKLVKIQDVDVKTRRPVYKLMTNAEYHQEELIKRKEKKEAHLNNSSKGDKLLSISSKIGEHDLMTRVRNAVKWLDKQYEVRVVITAESGDKMQMCENIYSTIESNLRSHGKIVQKRIKGNSLRFQILSNVSNKSPDQEEGLKDHTERDYTDGSKAPGGQGSL